MQTFLPYPSFEQSARVLDNKRLGKQRVECKQILNACIYGGGWKNHPAVRMWRCYEKVLHKYYIAISNEWISRGFRHSMTISVDVLNVIAAQVDVEPHWLGEPLIHLSHQSNLLRKNFEHYSKYFPGVPNDLPYVWPIGCPMLGKEK